MRYKHAVFVVACLSAVACPAPVAISQDDGLQPYYWPNRTVGIPIRDVDRMLKQPNKPAEAQLYYSFHRGPFQKGPKLALTEMKQFDSGSRGLLFTSDRDGDYQFTVQWINSDGTVAPPFEELKPQQRIIIDTTPPVIRIAPFANGVEWTVTDDNLDPRKLVLKCRLPGTRDWTAVNDRPLKPVDRFGWQLPAGKLLEVRLEAEDRAGHKAVSQVVRIPPEGPQGVSGIPTSRPGGAPPGISTPALPAPRIEYVNTLKFDVDYTIQHMGRSGIQAAHLFVLRNQSNWEIVKRFPIRLMPTDKEQTLSLPYEAKDEGTYGFYVIPESGAGKRAEDPRRDDPPLVWVVVDTTPPSIKITDVRVKPGGSRGPLVEITWEASDPNLMPQAVSLEWSTDKTATRWNEIKYRLDNLPGSVMGRYSWEVPDENLWKFWIRARAVDKASNTGESMWPQEVIVDLEQPSAGVLKVRGGNSAPAAPITPPPSGPKPTLPDSLPPSAPVVPTVPSLPPGTSQEQSQR